MNVPKVESSLKYSTLALLPGDIRVYLPTRLIFRDLRYQTALLYVFKISSFHISVLVARSAF
jgi:hypothetical protein